MDDRVAWEQLRAICRWPHRAAGSREEAECAEHLRAVLADLGAEVAVEPFPAPRDTLYRGPAVAAAAVAATTAAALSAAWPPAVPASLAVPAAALAIQAFFLALLIGEASGSPRLDFDRILPKVTSRNVVARLGGPGRRPLVLMAHHDTQRASWLFSPAILPALPAVFAVAYLALAAGPVAVAADALLPGAGWPQRLGLDAAAVLFAFAALLLWGGWRGRHVQGANDNGSGVAVALALARRWDPAATDGRPLWVVLTGAEEVGERGAKAFFRRHAHELDREGAVVVNLDNVGGGRLRFLTGEGMLGYVPYDGLLVNAARVLAMHRAPERVGPWSNLILPTDGIVARRLGFAAITWVGVDDRGRIPDYHWPTDTLERVDPDHLAFVADFLDGFLRLAARRDGTSEGASHGASEEASHGASGGDTHGASEGASRGAARGIVDDR